MGMFDSVWIKCPSCDNEVEFQSKVGDCILRGYSEEDVPTEIAKDIVGVTNRCGGCGGFVTASIAPRSTLSVKMCGV